MEYSCIEPELGSAVTKTVATMVMPCVPVEAVAPNIAGYAPRIVSVPPGAVMSTPPVPLNTHAAPLEVTPGFRLQFHQTSVPTSVSTPAVKRCAVNGQATDVGATPGGSGGLGGGGGGLGGNGGGGEVGGGGLGGLGGNGGGAATGHCEVSPAISALVMPKFRAV